MLDASSSIATKWPSRALPRIEEVFDDDDDDDDDENNDDDDDDDDNDDAGGADVVVYMVLELVDNSNNTNYRSGKNTHQTTDMR